MGRLKAIAVLALGLLLTSCLSNSPERMKALLEQLEFGEGETGCVTLAGSIDLNPIPMFTTAANLVYKKEKRGPEDDSGPDC